MVPELVMVSVIPGAARVVAGVSGASGSFVVVRHALQLARRNEAPLLAVLAWVPPGGDIADRRCPNAILRQVWARAARKRLTDTFDAACGGVPLDLEVQLIVTRGEPGPVLVEAAGAPADLLVVGAGRRGMLSRIWHGKVSRYCIAHARCPVLAVPHPATARQMGLGPATWALRYRDLTVNQVLHGRGASA
jgi:nucleotide-binding universal stress UspA family protein